MQISIVTHALSVYESKSFYPSSPQFDYPHQKTALVDWLDLKAARIIRFEVTGNVATYKKIRTSGSSVCHTKSKSRFLRASEVFPSDSVARVSFVLET